MLTVSDELLQGVVSGALERMAFVFVEQSELTNSEVLALSVAHAAISLRGAQGWTVTVAATAGLVQEVASGMRGCEPEDIDVDDHGRAAVSELANVFGGELVLRMAVEDESLQLGLPEELSDEGAGERCDRATEGGLTCVVGSELGDMLVTVSSD